MAPELLKSLDAYYEGHILPCDRRVAPRSLVEQVDQHVALVCDAIAGTRFRENLGCASAAALLFDKSNIEAGNEILVCELADVIFRGPYSAHFDDAAFIYSRGS